MNAKKKIKSGSSPHSIDLLKTQTEIDLTAERDRVRLTGNSINSTMNGQ